MTLRTRLSLVTVLLVTVGLLVADVATFTALRSFLLDRVDQQLAGGVEPTGLLLSAGSAPQGVPAFPLPPGNADPILPPGTHAALYDGNGTLIKQATLSYGGQAPAVPAIAPAVLAGASPRPSFLSLSASDGTPYRVVLQTTSQGTVALAVPLTDERQTLIRLLWIEVLVTLLVIALVASVSWATVRRGLRPLEQIEATAAAIAAGDLSQRIGEADPRTEVGRLGSSLNVMLGQIEGAMNEQQATQEALRRFLADASHELRTPLTSIRGYSELYRRGAGSNPQEAALAMRRIEQESARMGVLVDDLLFLARAGSSRPIEREEVDLARLLADAVEDARRVDDGRRITLEVPQALPVVGDGYRLHQVFANLLSNALAHTPSGSAVHITATCTVAGTEVKVRDEGPGMSAEDAAHVFEPFYRADAARERMGLDDTPTGTGLGLAIVEAIVEAHGGKVSVESRLDEGTTFTVALSDNDWALGAH
jgi:two-component system OmpR family sensor kinase